MNKDKILYVGDDSIWSNLAKQFLDEHYQCVEAVYWNYGESLPSLVNSWSGDWILSFKSDLILSQDALARAFKGAINFHPAPPKYRGIGGYSYALYNGDEIFGVTCHHIVKEIDRGDIIKVGYFPLIKGETSSSLRQRTGAYILSMFYEIVRLLIMGEKLPVSQEEWEGRLYTRDQFALFSERIVLHEEERLHCIS